ncbi:MAG: RidA family protein [Gemmatimonadales bacterium]
MRHPLAALAGALALAACSLRLYPTRGPVSTPGAPAVIGPYSQAMRAGDTLYLAGQVGVDPATGKLVEGGIEAETRRALENLKAVLAAAGYRLSEVVQAQVFLTDLRVFEAMNRVYAEYFPKDPPARATVQVAALPRGARVEIALVAVWR